MSSIKSHRTQKHLYEFVPKRGSEETPILIVKSHEAGPFVSYTYLTAVIYFLYMRYVEHMIFFSLNDTLDALNRS